MFRFGRSLVWPVGRSEFGRSKSNANAMPEFQPVPSARVSAIERLRCPNCQHNRVLLSKFEVGPRGFDYPRPGDSMRNGCVCLDGAGGIRRRLGVDGIEQKGI
jgi:hypothetical protein